MALIYLFLRILHVATVYLHTHTHTTHIETLKSCESQSHKVAKQERNLNIFNVFNLHASWSMCFSKTAKVEEGAIGIAAFSVSFASVRDVVRCGMIMY